MIDAGLEVRPLSPTERGELREVLVREWGGTQVVSRGRMHDAMEADAIGAFRGAELVGVATYELVLAS